MVVVAAGHRSPGQDATGVRVDDCHDVGSLHVDEDPVADRVVANVAGLAAEGDGADEDAAGRVDYGFATPGFVADPQLPGAWDVDQPVGVVPGWCTEHLGAGLFVEGDELVAAGRGGEHPVQGGHDDHPVDIGQPRDDTDHLPAVGVDLKESAGAELRHEQSVRQRVDVGVVEPARRWRQHHGGYSLERQCEGRGASVPAE